MHLLHTESSQGWGGQEIRILREAEGMRQRGHQVFFAVNLGAKLAVRAREAGFFVWELSFNKSSALKTIVTLVKLCKEKQIDIINTHSSKDAWLGGIAGRIAKRKVIRTRHLSTPIRKGINSRVLYKRLADFVVTTSSPILPIIQKQAKLSPHLLQCIPTGIDPLLLKVDPIKVARFRASLGVASEEILVGTACVVRSWKGIQDLLHAADLLRERKEIKWVIIGGGYLDEYRSRIPKLGLEKIVTFIGHLENPYFAIRALDIFVLLSTAHEGISQASLQAAFLERPLVTTTIGGLPEVCIEDKTGCTVPPFSPHSVAKAVEKLADRAELRMQYGKNARDLVLKQYTMTHTLDAMEKVYSQINPL